MKLQLDRLSKAKQEISKIKKENQKLKTKLKQTVIKFDEARYKEINLAEVHSKAAIEDFKKSLELQEYMNSYGIGSFNMACEDIREYLEAKNLTLDRSFIDIVQNTCLDSEDLDLALAKAQPINIILLLLCLANR